MLTQGGDEVPRILRAALRPRDGRRAHRQLDVLEADLRKVIQMKPDYAHAYNALGYTLAEKTDRLAEAKDLIEKAYKLSPDDPFILDSLGWVYYRMGDDEEALKHLQTAYGSRPDPEIAAHLGEVLWSAGKHDEAQKIWRAALTENPNHETLLAVMQKHPSAERFRASAGPRFAAMRSRCLAACATTPPATASRSLQACPTPSR